MLELPLADAGSHSLYLLAPDGREQPIFAAKGTSKVSVGPLDRCGVWSVFERARSVPSAKTTGRRFGG